MNGELKEAFAPMSVTITLEDDIDISRGDMIVLDNKEPEVDKDIDLMLCWLSEKPLNPSGKYVLRHTSMESRCMIKEISYKVDINNLEKNYEDLAVGLNEIARVKIKSSKSVFYDSYRRNRQTGSIILVEEGTNNTVGAGMIV